MAAAIETVGESRRGEACLPALLVAPLLPLLPFPLGLGVVKASGAATAAVWGRLVLLLVAAAATAAEREEDGEAAAAAAADAAAAAEALTSARAVVRKTTTGCCCCCCDCALASLEARGRRAQLALLLVESGEPEALQVFLQTKLQVRRNTWARRPSCLMSQAAGIAFSSCVLLSTRPQQLS